MATNIEQMRREVLSAKLTGWTGDVPLDPNYSNALLYRHSAHANFGTVRVVVHGERHEPERDANGVFEVEAVMVGGVNIISGLDNAQIESLADQAYWGWK